MTTQTSISPAIFVGIATDRLLPLLVPTIAPDAMCVMPVAAEVVNEVTVTADCTDQPLS